MPNPKSGTVTPNVAKAVKEAKAGRIEFRVDSTGIVHLGIGKVSFGEAKLSQNAKAVIASVKSAKPNSVKGNYVKSAFVASSMGPGIKVLPSEIN
jgi:large subunit ribosomal protein L1